ncbi:MAG TPA: hypothetical protein DIW81_29420 [Planctomycetaceae bacterium]|nr:hypothetical protein [Rubinisphaera sp.]HCS55661.1 hypothetical protein [Planctomycetaceae bacterium]|tara:strand:+ start:487 stop:708 length:222 start_codon:yes stop_codon:yes gene_type:complete
MNPPTEPVAMLTSRNRAGMLRQRTPQRLIAFSQTILVDFRSIVFNDQIEDTSNLIYSSNSAGLEYELHSSQWK